MPAFINLQQFYLEKALVDRALELNNLDLRWKNRVVGLERRNDGARLTIETPDGPYQLDADWLIAADGARSTVRSLLGLDFAGVTFEDKFLIADVHMAAEFPTERRFWFAPTFHSGQSALMHRQPDDVWRIDLQLGPDADPVGRAGSRSACARGSTRCWRRIAYELEWVSVYTFNCRRLDRFVHGRVIFIGDAAHQVSPFGARGANSGIQDAENLAWKLAARAQRGGRRSADRKLRSRAHPGGRREYRPLDPLDRFHVAAFERRAAAARRGAGAGAQGRVRAPHGQFRPAVAADGLRHRRCRRPTRRRSPARPSSARRCPTRRSPRPDGTATHLVENLRGDVRTHLREERRRRRRPAAAARRHRAHRHRRRSVRSRKDCSRSASTRRPARPISSAPTSICAPAGAKFDADAVARAHRRALQR